MVSFDWVPTLGYLLSITMRVRPGIGTPINVSFFFPLSLSRKTKETTEVLLRLEESFLVFGILLDKKQMEISKCRIEWRMKE